MRKLSFSHHGLPLACAVLLAVAAPGAPLARAASHTANLELLTAQLPAGIIPATAKMKDLDAAVRAAVAKRPSDAADIVRLALLAKKPRRGDLACSSVRQIVDAGIQGAPDQARAITDMAEALDPQCADTIAELLNSPIINATNRAGINGTNNAGATGVAGTTAGGGDVGGGDFGGGFGAGYPGSPGFSGSAPSGGFALPTPVSTPVTSSSNG